MGTRETIKQTQKANLSLSTIEAIAFRSSSFNLGLITSEPFSQEPVSHPEFSFGVAGRPDPRVPFTSYEILGRYGSGPPY